MLAFSRVALSQFLFTAILVFGNGCSNTESSSNVTTTGNREPKLPSPLAEVPMISTDGLWKTQSASMAGSPFPSSVTETITLKLAGDNYEVMVGNSPDKGKCTIDATPSPKQMTIVGTEGPNNGKTILAIFELPDESTLRVCYDLSGSAFPKSFDSTVENKYYSVTYTRQK